MATMDKSYFAESCALDSVSEESFKTIHEELFKHKPNFMKNMTEEQYKSMWIGAFKAGYLVRGEIFNNHEFNIG